MDLRMPSLVRFGPGCLESLPDVLAECRVSRPLVVGDADASSTGTLERTASLAEPRGRSGETWTEVDASLSRRHLARCRERLEAGGCDGLVAVGGGAVIDLCKAVAGLAAAGASRPPVVAVPATPSSGAELSALAVVATALAPQVDRAPVLPGAVIADPQLSASLPGPALAVYALDGLVHAIEAFVGHGSSPFTDLLSLTAVHLIVRSLPAAAGAGDPAGREAVHLGCLYAGVALASAGSGVVHAAAHPLTREHGIPHALAAVLVAPAALDATWSAAPWLHDRLAAALRDAGPPARQDRGQGPRIGTALRAFAQPLGVELGLGRQGVPARDVDRLAGLALEMPGALANVRCRVGRATLAGIYDTAWPDHLPAAPAGRRAADHVV